MQEGEEKNARDEYAYTMMDRNIVIFIGGGHASLNDMKIFSLSSYQIELNRNGHYSYSSFAFAYISTECKLTMHIVFLEQVKLFLFSTWIKISSKFFFSLHASEDDINTVIAFMIN